MSQFIHRRRGFTLIEVLVTVGIIVVLLALAIPAVLRARNTGIRTRVQSDMGLIATALSAYKADFGDYPRFPDPQTVANESAGTTPTQRWLDWSQPRGAVLLCESLIGPGPANGGNFKAGSSSSYTPGDDGADGPGFRVRRNFVAGTTSLAGKVYGPYLDASKFKISFLANAANPSFINAYPVMLDVIGNPILYYPATPSSVQMTIPGAYVAEANPQNYSSTAANPIYNAFDNENNGVQTGTPTYQNFISPAQLAYILGERTNASMSPPSFAAGEQAVTSQPYLLWSAGISGIFGFGVDGSGNPKVPATGMKTDNITNFDIPADLKK
jgi:prepilin-type N-terminal cleavage/methylation domain-containing protein